MDLHLDPYPLAYYASMATLRPLETKVIEGVAAQIADFIAPDTAVRFGAAFTEPRTRIHEYFPILTMPDTTLRDFRAKPPAPGSRVELSEFLIETGQWHYQILRDNSAVGYAHASQRSATSQEVRGISETGEAAAIEDAIRIIDAAAGTDEYEATMLDLPQVAVAALTLLDKQRDQGSRVCIFRAPSDQGPIPVRELISAASFIRLIVELRQVEGVRFAPPPNLAAT
jgi:hypothetical protein